MTDDRSPWERPAPGQEGGGVDWTYPSPGPRPGTTPPAGHHDQPTTATGYRTGTVTLLATPRTADVISVGPPDPPDPARRNRLILRWFGGGAAAVVIAGLVVLLAMIMTGNATGGLLNRWAGGLTAAAAACAAYVALPWLGPERGFISIDSEWLVIKFEQDRVVVARVVRD